MLSATILLLIAADAVHEVQHAPLISNAVRARDHQQLFNLVLMFFSQQLLTFYGGFLSSSADWDGHFSLSASRARPGSQILSGIFAVAAIFCTS
jgi:hypothetical protein